LRKLGSPGLKFVEKPGKRMCSSLNLPVSARVTLMMPMLPE
jgi:hypothetical protein